MINPHNKQQVFDILDNKKLTDKIFISIIDLIPLNKIEDVGSQFKFGRICWLLGYPCEYWDYLSKRSITKYNYEDNLKYYRIIYKEYRQRLIDILNKNRIKRK